MPDSQNVPALSGSQTIDEIRLVMCADPAPVPRLLQVLPPSWVAQSPFWATPATTISEFGWATTSPRLPHSEAMLERLPVAFAPFHARALASQPLPPLPPVALPPPAPPLAPLLLLPPLPPR